ncbi:PEP-CTERM sorting domain-containing protein [Opitutales bacterium]|nr:PEP-CTERM sorting domain-containing protein [Opitutales bacterium]MDB2506392.1 PEP-CTERM sorting domain-containing protein [Opitutales bacterium]
MKSNLLKLSIAAAAFAFSISSSNAQIIDGSTAYMGFSQFLVSTPGNNNSNLAEVTPDRSNEFLSGAIGATASGNGYGGYGKFTNNITGLNDDNFGSVVGGPDLTGVGGNSAIKFKTGDNRYRLDFMIKNESLTADFILDSIHFDSRVPDATANNAFVIQYLANNGNSNLQNMGTNANVSNLAFIAGTSLTEGASAAIGISEHDVSIAAQLAGGGAGVKLAAGDQASFRISWIGSSNINKQNQMDNLAISGVFAAVPEPSSYALLSGLFACTYMMVRRRAVS